jgi:hypothetical protein
MDEQEKLLYSIKVTSECARICGNFAKEIQDMENLEASKATVRCCAR